MILRECVRRHVRLPQVLVVDGGAEFHSTYFEVFLARYEVTKKTRPPAQARFGSVAERLFGTANTNFIHNLQGNTQITRNVRQVTKSVNPKEQAVWTLARLYDRLCEWAYEVYDTTPHPALGQSPRQAHNTGLITAGSRPNRLISYNQDFILDTLPTTLKGTAKVHIRDGVKINGIYYWSDDFRHPEVEGTNVPVRYDPYDAGITYAFVRGSWVKAVSEYYGAFKGRSEKEVLLATAELRKKLGSTAKGQKLTAKTRATFLNSLEAEEALMLQRQRDGEFEPILSRLAGNEPLPAISGGTGEAENTGQVPLTASVTRDRVEATLAEATNNTSPNSHAHQTQSTANPSSTKNSLRPRIIYEDY